MGCSWSVRCSRSLLVMLGRGPRGAGRLGVSAWWSRSSPGSASVVTRQAGRPAGLFAELPLESPCCVPGRRRRGPAARARVGRSPWRCWWARGGVAGAVLSLGRPPGSPPPPPSGTG
ncbi:hypothetical protein HBB16_00020 [Pseudonocardia sp. MCCB 268]|nr:hypothetical protein [Pseudonocardia cytotoxica]